MKRSLSQWLDWQEGINPQAIDLKLDRVQSVLARLQWRRPRKVISVAGTNGKGSSVAMLERLLADQGYSTGTYTSPHLQRYNERIRINTVEASDQQIVGAFESIEAARGDLPLTYFEYGTLAALVLFAAQDVDVAILEVGLGGRLDAVNAVDADVALITSIDLDHQDWLGDNREAIGFEKAGIMRPDAVCVFAGSDIPESVRAHAKACGSRLLVAGEDYDYAQTMDGGRWQWQGLGRAFKELDSPSLAGRHQIANAAGVVALLLAMRLNSPLQADEISRSLSAVRLPGRLQRIDGSPQVLIDVAHNPHAATELAACLRQYSTRGATLAVCAMLDNKDVAGTVSPLLEFVDRWYAASPESVRAIPARELAQQIAQLANKPCEVCSNIDTALDSVLAAAGPDDRLLIFGSFYIAGPALDRLAI